MQALKVTVVPVTPFAQNCSIVACTATDLAAIVDPGGDLPRIMEAIAQLGVTPERILLTHGHIDHAGAAADLADALSVPIEGPHEADAFLLAGLAEQGKRFGIAGARNVAPTRWFNEGDSVTVGKKCQCGRSANTRTTSRDDRNFPICWHRSRSSRGRGR